MRKALLLVLFRQLSIAAIFRFRKPDDVDNFNDLKSRMITEMMVEEISRGKCRLRVDGADLPELYFHFNGTETTVQIQQPRMLPPSCTIVGSVATDIFASSMDLSVTLLAVTVKGTVTFRQRAIRPNRSKESYPFGWTLKNVTGIGICSTRWTDTGYEVVDCGLKYGNFSILRAKPLGDDWPIGADAFVTASAERMRPEVTNALNTNVASGVNSLLQKIEVARFLRNPTVFQKYKNYVIESTENANEFVDGIMEAVRKIIRDRFHDSFAIPNIDEGFRRQGILLVWQGSFRADHGTVRGLSTVSRVGDTSFATDNTSQTHFFGNLSFDHLDLHYNRYKAEFMNLAATGTLNTRLRPIRIRIHPRVNFQTGKIHLEEFEIGEVGELVIDVTGLGTVFGWIVSKIATWVVGLARERVLTDLQKKYDEYIRSVLSGYTIDEIVNGKFT